MLYKLANQEAGFTPQKYFSIDKVFRNETLDATHLAEFHQVNKYNFLLMNKNCYLLINNSISCV